ncbi:Hydrolase [Hexamita inflata]|uniref:Hydrolase n=1 Tax=Hexamita inflata TaxID=28002 RepID=A0AA86Q7D1_9EUKA|nr:Hydrolase [Hexamita inflata]
MDSDLMMLQMLFGDQIQQSSENQVTYTADQLTVVFTFPVDYPDQPFTYTSNIQFTPELTQSLLSMCQSCLDFITFLSQNFVLTNTQKPAEFKRAIIDTHSHFLAEYYKDNHYQQQLDRFNAENGSKVIIIASTAENLQAALDSAIQNNFYCTAGIHPKRLQELFEADPVSFYQKIDDEFAQLQKFLKDNVHQIKKRIVAIGELGISSDDEQVMRLQLKLVQKQFDLALKLDLPVIVHAHKKHQLQLINDLLMENQAHYKNIKLVIHGFSAEVKQLEELQTFNCYFSCNLILLKQSGNFKKAVKRIGIDKVLVETDSPFVTGGAEVSGPADVLKVLRKLSEELEMGLDQLNETVNNNAMKLFQIEV